MIGQAPSKNYDVTTIEVVVLEIAAELHPQHLSACELTLTKIVSKPTDAREVETVAQAIQNLRELGALVARDDEIVEPAPATIHLVRLLTSS